MKFQPKISIVIPAYNHELYIEEAICSAINQTYKNIEVLVLDDGSTDSTWRIIKKIAKLHSQIRPYSHDNIGAHKTINKGIIDAQGEYIAVLNSDDIFNLEKIERCIEIIDADRSIELVSGNVQIINSKSEIQENGITIEWLKWAKSFYAATNNLPLSILNENFVTTTSNIFFSKNLWGHCGGFQNLRYCHDLDFLMSAFRLGKCYYDGNYNHIKYRVHQNNTIKEDLQKVRLELASVIASSIILNGTQLLGGLDLKNIEHIPFFLKNKSLNSLIMVLVAIYSSYGDRTQFYDALKSEELISQMDKFLAKEEEIV